MITSIHTLIYSDNAQATRTFLRDVLGWKYVTEDWDNDWLIFKSGPSEMGVHPTHSVWEGKTYDHPRQHSIAIMCDDIDATVDELKRERRAVPRRNRGTRPSEGSDRPVCDVHQRHPEGDRYRGPAQGQHGAEMQEHGRRLLISLP